NGKSLKFREIAVGSERQQKQQIRIKRRKPNIPSAEHPWRKFKIRRYMKRHKRQEDMLEPAV
ncbi:MAG: hypothetical protein L6246_01195, partial [Thermodesulfovibrionales bacterium]|nr:hypothetical protein [Thermodesulfovibrionales bacterium]